MPFYVWGAEKSQHGTSICKLRSLWRLRYEMQTGDIYASVAVSCLSSLQQSLGMDPKDLTNCLCLGWQRVNATTINTNWIFEETRGNLTTDFFSVFVCMFVFTSLKLCHIVFIIYTTQIYVTKANTCIISHWDATKVYSEVKHEMLYQPLLVCSFYFIKNVHYFGQGKK